MEYYPGKVFERSSKHVKHTFRASLTFYIQMCLYVSQGMNFNVSSDSSRVSRIASCCVSLDIRRIFVYLSEPLKSGCLTHGCA